MAPSTTPKRATPVSPLPDTTHYPMLKSPEVLKGVVANLKRERERLKTFRNWNVSFMNSRDLAKNGFYYTNELDIVKCAFCGIEIGFWENGDDPKTDHMRWEPKCEFVNGKDCGNIPIEEGDVVDLEEDAEDGLIAFDTCGPFRNETRPFSGPERISPEIYNSASWKELAHLGATKSSGPITPKYNTYESRLKTFQNWPAGHSLKPEALAQAGFYFLQIHDNTMCFYCGGGLKDWKAEDDPWVEHARWFNMCGFVRTEKGNEFVDSVVSKKKPVLTGKALIEICQNTPSVTTAKADPVDEAGACIRAKPEESNNSSSTSSSSKEMIELCRICCEREREIVFLPCGHFVCCRKCAPSLSNCAVCRKPYEATIRAYLS